MSRHIYIFFVCVLWFIPFSLSAQRYASGRITDAEDGNPIPGAAVFIANTTVGTTTDSVGYYRLKIPGEGSYSVVVSHVAYKPVFKKIGPGKTPETIHVVMQTLDMKEVTVSANVKFRKVDIRLFWSTLLGQKPSNTIQPVNPEAVYYYFDSSTGKLKVTCREPLQIINLETGYKIYYSLNYFTHDYRTGITTWEGECFFTELEHKTLKQKKTWDKNRKYVYSVSVDNFIKSLYNNTLLDHGFMFVWEQKRTWRTRETVEGLYGINSVTTIFKDVVGITHDMVDSKMFVSTDSLSGNKMFYIPSDLNVMLLSYGEPVNKGAWARDAKGWKKTGLFRNYIDTPMDTVQIFPDGTYRNYIRLSPIFQSYPITGLNLALPIDYHSNDNSGETAVEMAATNDHKIQSINPLADTLFRAAEHFDEQLAVFPQEKVYLHTDKPYYISGERIWFRAHVVDAATHVPSFSPGSVYVELFDTRDSVVSRIKTGLANDLFSGYIPIPEDAPEGDYTIRAYTGGMRNLDEDYFFMKNIRIGHPMSRIMQAVPEFEFLPDKKVGAGIRFSRIRPLSPFTPESVKISINSGKLKNVSINNGVSWLSFDQEADNKQQVMLLEAISETHPYRQYIRIPLPDDDFDVSFYPEGGSMLAGNMGRIAFKAMQRDGTEVDVSGTVYDSRGKEIISFRTDVRGMGQFSLNPEPGETYHAFCTNGKGQTKRFELPVAKEKGYVLSASWMKDRLVVNVVQCGSRKTNDTLCLLVHTRGVVQDVRILENTNEPVVFSRDFFPSGISHLLLLNKDMVPVSERLVFSDNKDQAKVVCKSDREAYPARSPVEYTVNISDESGEPMHGNFSVSVTDDQEVVVDTTSCILTTLLLTSDLRGHLPDPGYYFRKKDHSLVYALDLLMLTQGWRRYDTERIVRNEFMYPDTLPGKGYDISGTVKTVLTQKAVAHANVSMLSFGGGFATGTVTDLNGRFYLQDGGVVDSTRLVIQTAPKSGRQNLELILDRPSYPERAVPVVASGMPDREVFAKYADKAELQYEDEHGTRIIHIEEVTITAQRKKAKDYSFFYKSEEARFSITEDELDKFPAASMSSLLMRIPGIIVSKNHETNMFLVSYGRRGVFLMVDGIKENADILNTINPHDIGQIELLTGPVAAIFTGSIDSYVIAIYTKRGKPNTPRETPYIKPVILLGLQKPAEFYAPKYGTSPKNTKPDLRTTIHWQPNITTDENGKASFRFYTADAPSTYTVVIEGMTADGKIVYQRDRISVVSKTQ